MKDKKMEEVVACGQFAVEWLFDRKRFLGGAVHAQRRRPHHARRNDGACYSKYGLSKASGNGAIKPGVDRDKGGAYPNHYGVVVETGQQSYIFSCIDSACGKMEIAGTMYSRYSEETPMLPLGQ